MNTSPLQSPCRTLERHVPHAPVREEVLELRLPVTFTAFCVRRLPAYVRFATACTGCHRTGRNLAQDALGDLATIWEHALRSASPAAISWNLISERGSSHARLRSSSVYRVLSRPHADAVVLRYRLGMTAAEVAELMGIDEAELKGMLHYATRLAVR
ncbi:hypothetical protein MHW47_05115 [Streptomyces sp. OfavH-34-F]|uniref:hypothetical protein n=1 Tax=Streptomyces sp. OfavH-34-F TaxID=2917760 RepID=UPI001EF1B727|nr:hypothetical protein [Streptomyces sp. OfavH-34-F]MCG7523828.1 hypothetical protein [Streptomyces sp. OfavH-34-F]